jgi:hypothetical protein
MSGKTPRSAGKTRKTQRRKLSIKILSPDELEELRAEYNRFLNLIKENLAEDELYPGILHEKIRDLTTSRSIPEYYNLNQAALSAKIIEDVKKDERVFDGLMGTGTQSDGQKYPTYLFHEYSEARKTAFENNEIPKEDMERVILDILISAYIRHHNMKHYFRLNNNSHTNGTAQKRSLTRRVLNCIGRMCKLRPRSHVVKSGVRK